MSQSPDSGSNRPSRIALDLRYSLFTLAYVAMIYWLSAHLDPWNGGGDPLTRLVSSLYHLPLYAGLGFFVLQAISGGKALAAHRRTRAALTFAAVAVVAMLDEWRQVYTPGRNPSFGDVMLDIAGVAGLLLICSFGTTQVPRP